MPLQAVEPQRLYRQIAEQLRQLIASGAAEPFRTAATILSFIFVLGLVALIWAPETKGKPLPED